MNNSFSSKFSTFEILRIILPGLYFVVMIFLYLVSFEAPLYPFENNIFSMLFFPAAIIVAGLSFYAKETPKKRKAFLSNQPSIYLLNRSRTISAQHPLTEDDARRIYFYVLNHYMPITVHDKIFFFGMVYHVMISIRRSSFWFGFCGIIGLIIQIALTSFITPLSFSTVLLSWLIYFINVRYNKADRKMQENYQDQIFWLEMNADIVDKLITRRVQLSEQHDSNLS